MNKIVMTLIIVLILASIRLGYMVSNNTNSSIYQKEAIITKVEKGKADYKYKVTFKLHTGTLDLYTNIIFNIGDTLVFNKKEIK